RALTQGRDYRRGRERVGAADGDAVVARVADASVAERSDRRTPDLRRPLPRADRRPGGTGRGARSRPRRPRAAHVRAVPRRDRGRAGAGVPTDRPARAAVALALLPIGAAARATDAADAPVAPPRRRR